MPPHARSAAAASADVVVIGAGFGGLAAGVRLLAAGHRVVMVDSLPQVGGRARTFQVDGFSFDAGPTVLTGIPMFEELFTLGGRVFSDHVDLVTLDPFYRVIDADGHCFDYHQDETRFLDEVKRIDPREVPAVERVLERTRRMFAIFHPYTERPMLHFRVMLAMLPYLIRHRALQSVRASVRREVRHSLLRSSLEFHPLLVGGNPARTPSLYALIDQFEREGGVHYALGGTTAVVRALQDLFLALGGHILSGSSVSSIELQGRRVVGVRLDNGELLPADAVVSNADPQTTYLRLLGDSYARRWPGRFTSLLWQWRRPSMSLFVLYFGLNRRWPDTALLHHSILLSGDADAALDRVFDGTGGNADGRFLYVHLPTRSDDSIAPPGCEALYVLVSAPALRGASDQPEHIATVRRDVIDVLERHLPGFEDSIIAEHSVDPAYFRDVLQTPRGAAFSLQPTLLQSAWFRPHNRSPRVQGLYLVGAGTHPGAGVPAVLASAKVSVQLLLDDLQRWARA